MKTIYAPAGLSEEPLADLKQWLAITTNDDDHLLIELIGAAHALCERFTGVVPFKCEVRETFPTTQLQHRLTADPILYFLDINAIENGLGRRLLTDGEATLERSEADGGVLKLAEPISEPQVEAHYYAGLSDQWSMVADGLRHGIIRHAAHYYRERDHGPSASPPAAVAALWRPYRRLRL